MRNLKREHFALTGPPGALCDRLAAFGTRLVCVVAGVGICLAPLAWAEEMGRPVPGGESSATREGSSQPSASAADSSESSPCVLLGNDNVLFGTARQVGEWVVVTTGEGGEIKLARQEVLCWANSLRNLYRYRVDHRRRGDLSALVRDARWCLRYDLYDLAAQEVSQIRRLDPENAEAQRIEDQLRRQVDWQTHSKPPSESAPNESSKIRIVGYEDPTGEDQGAEVPDPFNPQQEEPGIAVDAHTLQHFASHIQPMLANRCGRCHERGKRETEGWTLILPSAGSRASSRMTRDNLTSVLAYIDINDPEQSPLLTKAITAHGDAEPPLDARNAKAIEAMQTWLWGAASSMLRASDQAAASPPSAPMAANISITASHSTSSQIPPRLSGKAVEPSSLASRFEQTAVRETAELPSDSAEMPSGPARLPQVTNPFDPELFNRRFHIGGQDVD